MQKKITQKGLITIINLSSIRHILGKDDTRHFS